MMESESSIPPGSTATEEDPVGRTEKLERKTEKGKRIANENGLATRKAKNEAKADAKKHKSSKKSKKASKPGSTNIIEDGNVQVETPAHKSESVAHESRKSERSKPEDHGRVPKAKKVKKSKKSHSGEVKMAETPTKVEVEVPLETETKEKQSEPTKTTPDPEIDEESARKERKRQKRERKRQLELAKGAEKAGSGDPTSAKKRKRSKDQDEETAAPVEIAKTERSLGKKRVKSDKLAASGRTDLEAQQWNPDALTGDAARKEKFLRLLGAGKANGNTGSSPKYKPKSKTEDILKVQSELERQYESGMKMKHDGKGHRRGLGA